MRGSKALAQRIEAIEEFRAAYVELVEHHVESEVIGFGTTGLFPREGSERAIAELRPKVERAAGRAQHAAKGSGLLRVHNLALDPVMNWTKSLGCFPDRILSPDDVLGFCDRALGRLEQERQNAQRHERSLVGLVARFVGFPAQVRAAAGLKRGTAAGSALTISVALIQLAITIGGTIVAGLILAKVFGIGS